MKVAMLGESGVGKTCIINRYVSNTFKATESTKGASFKPRTLSSPDGKVEIRQMIWDTAGQEIYRSLASFYYRDADAVVLVYDITNQKSFEALSYWTGEIKQNGKQDVILAVVGNKSDRVEEEAVDVSLARQFAKDNKGNFFLVSAKDNLNVSEMYVDLAIRKFPHLKKVFSVGEGEEASGPIKTINNGRRSTVRVKLQSEEKSAARKKDKGCC